jgi:hypothetical protein
MSGRGPQPKDVAKRARTNADPIQMRILPRLLAEQPELPEFDVLTDVDGVQVLVAFEWPARTREWWQMWADSALAAEFTSTDWSELLDTALIHARIWQGELKWLPELRLRTAKFGATPEDRARLRIQFAQADEADEKRVRPIGARSRFGGMRVESDLPAEIEA